jgi:SAM-dependent methyltransferase
MNSYVGRHAELYDLFYAEKPYEAEAAFVHERLQALGDRSSRLLEIACGTGRHALALGRRGYQIVALDYSPDMIAAAERNQRATDQQISFRCQDMRQLDVPERPFDAVVCLFDSIGYVSTNEALRDVLRGVHDHLRPDGLFVFEFWHAAAMLRAFEATRVRRWKLPGREILRLSETRLVPALQLATVEYTIYEHGEDGRYARLHESQTNRYFLVQEMAGWLDNARLKPLRFYAGFTPSEVIDEQTWHVVAVAQRID